MSSKSPFKDNKELQKAISKFLNDHRATFIQTAKRTSAYFEIAIYNDLVRFYEKSGYTVSPKNLSGPSKTFMYALSPSAKPGNYSYFEASRTYANGDEYHFEIRHNLRIQSSHDTEVFVTPDYAVIQKGSILAIKLPYYFNGKADYWYVPAGSVRTFAESKHYNPSPELVLNFVGLVNELIPGCLNKGAPLKKPKHFAPSLFVSGVGNAHIQKIKNSLGSRYLMNVFLGMFKYPTQLHSASNQSYVQKIGTP